MVTPEILDGLEVYLVGGAVRDRLMGLPVKDRDWVVVGSTPDEMKSRGFKAVGQQFPVFLHPRSGEEYSSTWRPTRSCWKCRRLLTGCFRK